MKASHIAFILIVSLIPCSMLFAQDALPIRYFKSDGLPGESLKGHYNFDSPVIQLDHEITTLRISVIETNNSNSTDYAGYPSFGLSELYVKDENGRKLWLKGHVTTNAPGDNKENNPDDNNTGINKELNKLFDNDESTYFLSSINQSPNEYHYLEITFPRPLSTFSWGYVSKGVAYSPTDILLTEGKQNIQFDSSKKIIYYNTIEETIPGEEWELNAYTLNDTPFTAFQMDYRFPNEVSIVNDMSDVFLSPRASTSHILHCGYQPSKDYRVLSYSMSNENFTENKGSLLTMILTADKVLQPGNYPINIKNIVLADEQGSRLTIKDMNLTLIATDTDTHINPMEQKPIDIHYYTIDGRQICSPHYKGIVICHQIYADGHVVVKKIIKK